MYAYRRDTLMSIAKHYETGENIPDEIYKKLLAARTFRAGSQSLRQVCHLCQRHPCGLVFSQDFCFGCFYASPDNLSFGFFSFCSLPLLFFLLYSMPSKSLTLSGSYLFVNSS